MLDNWTPDAKKSLYVYSAIVIVALIVFAIVLY
jgi:hypothetical protein